MRNVNWNVCFVALEIYWFSLPRFFHSHLFFILVFNLSQETQKVDISGVDLGGEGTIGGMLLTGEDTITLDNNELTLPSYSMALITVE